MAIPRRGMAGPAGDAPGTGIGMNRQFWYSVSVLCTQLDSQLENPCRRSPARVLRWLRAPASQ